DGQSLAVTTEVRAQDHSDVQAEVKKTEFKPFIGTAKRMDGQSRAVTTEVREQDHSDFQAEVNKEHEGFKAFTGKSFRLM
ncbi:hypothetical protein Tco_1199359, partial [Tanacetum coccineum]